MTKPKMVKVVYKGELEQIYLMYPNHGIIKQGDTLEVKASQLDELKEVGFEEVEDKKGGEK